MLLALKKKKKPGYETRSIYKLLNTTITRRENLKSVKEYDTFDSSNITFSQRLTYTHKPLRARARAIYIYMRCIIKFVTQNNDIMCKVLPLMFHRFICV